MRWSSQILFFITLAAALSTNALAQRGGFGTESHGSGGRAAIPSSTALGMGANASGRASLPSSTAIGAGAPARSGFASNTGFGRGNGSYGNRGNSTSRAGRGYRGDYRNVPFGYFVDPYYYPFLDYGSAPYGGGPEDAPYDASADTALVTQNLMGEQIQRLSAELDQMKYAQQQPTPQAMMQAPANAQPAPPVVPVTVVLRNGQKLQVQNYAVMDHTFWDFSKQPARRIPISSIDVSASSQATAANGGEFPDLDFNR